MVILIRVGCLVSRFLVVGLRVAFLNFLFSCFIRIEEGRSLRASVVLVFRKIGILKRFSCVFCFFIVFFFIVVMIFVRIRLFWRKFF